MKARIVIGLEGGLVSGISADRPDIEVIVVDYDTEGSTAADGVHTNVPQAGGNTAEAFVSNHGTADFDPKWVSEIYEFDEAHQ